MRPWRGEGACGGTKLYFKLAENRGLYAVMLPPRLLLLLCREMLSQRCNIHLGTGSPGGCIGLQCYTKYPGALTSLMKSPLAAAAHYCTLPCLSHGDLSLDLSVCLFVSPPGWLLRTAVCVCVTAGRLLPTLTLFVYAAYSRCVLFWRSSPLTLHCSVIEIKIDPKRSSPSFLKKVFSVNAAS